MKDEEHRLQCACITWARHQYPLLRGVFFAIPNGGARTAITGARLKAEGVLAGVADLFLAAPRGKYHGLFIEMKTETGRLQPTQVTFRDEVTEQGYMYAVCRSYNDFRDIVDKYLAL